MAALRIGTSGYQYDHWQGVLYPEGIPKSRWFGYYVQQFDTVEVNNTFYRLPKAKTFAAWREQAPPGFCYALKFSRYGSHNKYLKDPQEIIGNFLARAEHLQETLGPILVQLPPRWRANSERLAAFLNAAPRRYRWAIEFRHPSWLCQPIYLILEEHNAALCIHDRLSEHPWRITADWLYLRFHGSQQDNGSYSQEFLSTKAQRIRECLSQGLDVFAYFNNDVYGHAVYNATELKHYVEAD